MKFAFMCLAMTAAFCMTACNQAAQNPPESQAHEALSDEIQPDKTITPEETVDISCPENDIPDNLSADDSIRAAAECLKLDEFRKAHHILAQADIKFGDSPELQKAWNDAIQNSPRLNAESRKLTPGVDLSTMKRLGGGSSLVYKFIKDKKTFAAFKPFQKRYQSNYRAEIASYRLCPLIRCGFDIPVNYNVYFDFNEFSSLYSHNSANPKAEFKEIIPNRQPDGSYRVYGTQKEWVPGFAIFPIELVKMWQPWLNPGTSKDQLNQPSDTILPFIEKNHKRGKKVAQDLAPHLVNLPIYKLARQISNLIVFDFLINNWDRFSGAPDLFGVNCQFLNGYFISIDNGASFPKTPSAKPDKHLHEITRFSRITFDAIGRLEHDSLLNWLFPEPTKMEIERFETFWNQRTLYINYVNECIAQNGEEETFFFE